MGRFHAARTASLVISLLGAIFNFTFAVQVLAAWRSLKWEPESEWEGAADSWRVDGVKLVWGLLSAYFVAAASACLVGLVGILKNRRSLIRFYRDYSIADFSFCSFFTIVGAYAAFRTSTKSGVCEELSRQPQLMRDLVEMGLNLENCEQWFQRAVLAILGGMLVVIVVRLHFLIAVSSYYSQLSRHTRSCSLPSHHRSDSLQRIYLLPRVSSLSPTSPTLSPQDDPLVYAPVPLSTLSPNLRSSAKEAWITHDHRHRRSTSGGTGRISLPVRAGEGLLPDYSADVKA